MPSALNHIKSPVSEELDIFNKKFKAAMKSKVPMLNKVTYFLLQRKGKQMRPLMVMLSAKMFGDINENTYTGASLIELLHTATLVHDDVVDDAHKRRGFFSVNALWKNKVAVLVGDYLLSRSLGLAMEKEAFNQLRNLSEAVQAMSEGELLQIEKARKLNIDEEVYYDIIKSKTASLVKAAFKAGTMSTASNLESTTKMGEIGEKIGLAFQIKDDLFDYDHSNTEKPSGIDIKEKKLTLPLIYTLNNVSGSEKRSIINTVKNHNTDKIKVNEVIQKVVTTGGIKYATEAMLQLSIEAIASLKTFPENEARNALIDLVTYTIEREK